MAHMGYSRPSALTTQDGFTERDRIKLQRYISGLRISTDPGIPGLRVIKKITLHGAQHTTFQTREGTSMTVAVCVMLLRHPRYQLNISMVQQQYFRNTYRKNLAQPNLPCVEVSC